MYHISFPKDSKMLKATVYIIYLTETIYTIMLAYDLTLLVIEPGYNACSPSLIVPIFGGLGALPFILHPDATDLSEVALMTQAVYTHRIWIITQIKFISIGFIVVRKSEESSLQCSFAIIVANRHGSCCFIYTVGDRDFILR